MNQINLCNKSKTAVNCMQNIWPHLGFRGY